MRKKLLSAVFFLAAAFAVWPDPIDNVSLKLVPRATLPAMGSQDIFKPGGGLIFEAAYRALPFLSPYLEIGYDIFPTLANKNLKVLRGGGGLLTSFFPSPRIGFFAGASGGYYQASWDNEKASDLFGRGSAGAVYRFTPAFSLQLGGSYEHFFIGRDALYRGFGIQLGGTFNLGGLGSGSSLLIHTIRSEPVFPIFHTYYENSPFGSLTITNHEDGSIQNVQVSLFVNNYMDQPYLTASVPSLGRGESREVPLKALFNDQVLRLTESTRMAAEIRVDYLFLGTPRQSAVTESLRVFHRNAMTWDDDRKAAAFVSSKDPAVLRFSRYAAGIIRETGTQEISQNLRFALGLFEGLRLYGLNYVIDPTTPYKEMSQAGNSLDYLQFPYQTLVYKGGDCDDLSILYAAVLESVGISTAFITIPGHIYVAFDLAMDEEEARRTFTNPSELIFVSGRTWLPVEITLLNEGFQRAWSVGAKQWQDNDKDGTALLIPIEDAWDIYEPVGIPGEDTRIVLPSSEDIVAAYNTSLSRFITREITPRVELLRNEIASSGNSPRVINRLGVLYARFGLYDQARAEFERAARGGHYAPALVNLGNVAYLQKDFRTALDYYQRALARSSTDKTALLGVARAQFELENYQEADRAYMAVQGIDPALAGKFGYLASRSDGIARASSAAQRGGAQWDEE